MRFPDNNYNVNILLFARVIIILPLSFIGIQIILHNTLQQMIHNTLTLVNWPTDEIIV